MRPDATGQAHSAHTAREASKLVVILRPLDVEAIPRARSSKVFGPSVWVAPKEAYNYAAEIKVRSYRHLGEILKDTPKNAGTKGTIRGSTDGSGGTILVPPDTQPPTLAEVGLTKKQSSKARLLRLCRIRPRLIFDVLLWLNNVMGTRQLRRVATTDGRVKK